MGVPDGWLAVAILMHGKNFAASEGAGIDVLEHGIGVDTGWYRYDLPWESLLFAYTIERPPPAHQPMLCFMANDSRPICMQNVSFRSADGVVAALNKEMRERDPLGLKGNFTPAK